MSFSVCRQCENTSAASILSLLACLLDSSNVKIEKKNA